MNFHTRKYDLQGDLYLLSPSPLPHLPSLKMTLLKVRPGHGPQLEVKGHKLRGGEAFTIHEGAAFANS